MNTKHTAGPWTLEPDYKGYLKGTIDVSSKDHGGLATVVWVMSNDASIGEKSPECEANARLIAAAPELLEALQQLLVWDDGNLPGDLMDAARAAITKAKGEA